MVRWSWVDRSQIEDKLKKEPLAVGSTPVVLLWQRETDPTGLRRERGSQERPRLCWWRHWKNSVSPSGESCLDNAIHGGAQMVKHNRMLLDALLHLHGRGTFSC